MARKKKAKKPQDDTSQLQESEKVKQLSHECDNVKKRQTPESSVTEQQLMGASEPVVDLTVNSVRGQQKASDRVQNIVTKLSEQSKKSGFRDGRLLGRMKEYLSGLANKNFVSIPLMAEHLQNKYPEYRRKKKGPFVQYVDRAYFSMEKGTTARVKDEMGGEISSDTSEEEGDEEIVEYKDTNAMNSMMSSLYKNSPAHASEGKRRNADSPARDLKRPKVTTETSKAERVLYASPDALSRNLNSTGLVGPRRTAQDKYFIDRMGGNSIDNEKEGDTKVTDSKVTSSREANIKEFLSGLPSRTSFSSYVNSKQDPRLKSGSLYRVYKSDEGENEMQGHSGITNDNEGVSRDPPLSPGDKGATAEDSGGAGSAEGKDKGSFGRNDQEPQTKGEKSRSKAGRKGKDGSRSKKTNDSEAEDTKSDKGPAVQKSNLTFADVGGNDATLTDICKLLVHMRHPEVYNQLGITPPRGFLLHGPPGCGKTLLANAIAGELELPLLKIAATEIVSGVSGDSEQKVRQLFDKAVQSAPCVVFIDEIDSITPKRETASKDMERRIVAQLLSCMDDLSASTEAHVLVIGATNRPDSLDPALRRAGRFDREICLGIPDETARRKILEVLCRPLRLIERFDFTYLARNTPGYVGADLMALAREAAMVAVNRAFQDIQQQTSTLSKGVKPIAMETDTSDNVTSSKENVSASILADANIPSQASETIISKLVNGEDTTANSDPRSVIEGDIANTEAINTNDSENSIGANNVADTKGDSNSNNPCDSASGNKLEDVTVQLCDSLNTESMDTTTKSDSGISETCHESKSEKQVEDCDSRQKSNHSQAERDCSSTSMQNTVQREKSTVKEDLFSVLSWLKETPPLTEDQLRDLYITLDDFKEALQFVQPSAKREGFATIPDVSWDDIGALQDVREELQLAVLAPVRHAEEFKSLGLNRAQGILLAGPPGCGKTLLAKAVANESGINFISVKGPELLNMYVGESEKAVRTVFQRARNSSPCVIFFDELDALCPRRSGSAEGGSSARVVNQLLTEMDGLEERKQVFIMAATNRPDIIDPAILRPGRLDKTLYVGLPTQSDRKDIFTCITKNGTKPLLADNVDLAELAVDTRCDGYTGADLAALVREASVVALRAAILNKGRQPGATITVTKDHFETAFSKIRPSVSAKDQEKYKSMRQTLIQPNPVS